MKHLKIYENIDSLLGDLGELGLVKDRAYIECIPYKKRDSALGEVIAFPDLNRKRGRISMADLIFEFEDLNFEIILSLNNRRKFSQKMIESCKKNSSSVIKTILDHHFPMEPDQENSTQWMKSFLIKYKERFGEVDLIVYIEGKEILKV